MPLHPALLAEAADALWGAAATGHCIPPLRDTHAGLDADDAYAIQRLNTDRRLAEGRRSVGCKIGLTSRAVQAQLGVDQPDFGVIFDDMGYGDAEPIPMHRLQQPKVEAEIAFVLGRDLEHERPGLADVIGAVDHVLPAIEVVSSRIANWNIRFVDTVADNASSGLLVLGGRMRKVEDLDLRLLGVVVSRNGEMIDSGAGAAALGNPARCVAWLANKLGSLGSGLKAGDIMLPGAVHKMVPVTPGDVFRAEFAHLGAVTVRFSKGSE